MPLDNRLTTVLLLAAFNVGHLAASPDPRVIAYDDLKSTADVFSEARVTHFSQLLVNGHEEQQELIVGARDNIYRLAIDHLRLVEKAQWEASDVKIRNCIWKGQSEIDCRNYINVLHANKNELIACGTDAFSPNCTKRELKNINRITREFSGVGRCPYSPHANATSLVSEDGSFFAGTSMSFAETDSAIVRFSDTMKFLRTTQFDSKWLNDPQFVGSFETDSFVYFLFREMAVEYMNCGKAIYSRIARVCKQDEGYARSLDSWTTFVKARLNCSWPGEYPFYFDEIQGVTYLPDTGLLYATFTTPRNSIAGSAVCLFNLTAINAAFNGPYKHQPTMFSTWESTPNVYQKQCQNGLGDPMYHQSSNFQLMDNAVQPITSTPLYHSQLERIVHIAVDELVAKRQSLKNGYGILAIEKNNAPRPLFFAFQTKWESGFPRNKIDLHVLYISTEENIIKKISVLPDTKTTCILEIWKPVSSTSDRILSMHYLKEKESLYIGTESAVMRIPSQHCDRYKNRQTCLNAKDPYCGWNEHLSQCTPPPEKNLLIPYWNQLIDGCPSFTNPVPGGWSKWSSWTECDQADSLNKIDQCFCSTRQCNNPAPQNGGADCEGVHIRVTNCTAHGGWTEWSEWSACSQTCGKDAVKTRKRSCTNPAPAFGGRVCVGPESEFNICTDNPPCPPPAPAYPCSPWRPWSECTAKCGVDYQYRTREVMSRAEGSNCPASYVEVRKCNLPACPLPPRAVEWTSWTCSKNEQENRYRISGELHNLTFIKINVQREERNSSERAHCSDICGHWSNWSVCDQSNIQIRTRKCMAGNNGRQCPCSDEESRSCYSNLINQPIVLEGSASISMVTLLLACFLSFILGIGGLALFCYYKIKKEHRLIPSSPLYATKQNFYVNVPLRDPPTPKRTPSFTKNSSTLANGTPKVYTKPLIANGTATVKAIVKPMEYDTATIKRNSNNLKNGYARSFDFDADADRYS